MNRVAALRWSSFGDMNLVIRIYIRSFVDRVEAYGINVQ